MNQKSNASDATKYPVAAGPKRGGLMVSSTVHGCCREWDQPAWYVYVEPKPQLVIRHVANDANHPHTIKPIKMSLVWGMKKPRDRTGGMIAPVRNHFKYRGISYAS